MTREEIIKGLEAMYEAYLDSEVIERDDYGDTAVADRFRNNGILIHAAVELLKEQEDTRLTPRTPDHTRVAYTDNDTDGGFRYWITDQCPECVERGELGIWDTLVDRPAKYCRRCGQALDWSEYDGRDQIDWDEYMSHIGERTERILRRRKVKQDGANPDT